MRYCTPSTIRFLVIGVSLVGIPGLAGTSSLEIPLTVKEPAGVARTGAPVASGVCLPRGALPADQTFLLLEGEREVPLQTTPLVVETDGTVRWVLLDFQTDIDAGATKRFVLQPCPGDREPAELEHRIRVDEDGKQITVHTGALTFRVRKDRPFELLDSVRAKGEEIVTGGSVAFIEGRSGRRYLAGPPSKVSFEYRGPLRVTLRVKGAYRPAEAPAEEDAYTAGYLTRITCHAGSAALRIEHILSNSDPRQVSYLNIRSASLELRHSPGREARAAVGAGDVGGALGKAGQVWLHQGKENRYYSQPIEDAGRAGVGERVLWKGADSGGWLLLEGEKGSIYACDRDFLGDPPRRLEANAERLRIEFVAEKLGEGRGVPFESDHCWLYDLSHKVADVLLDFAPQADPDGRAREFRGRLMAFASPEWYAECDGLGVGRFGTLQDEKTTYEEWGWRYRDEQVPRSPHAPHAFVRWEDNHYESEADSAEALLLMALRTGERGFFDQGEAWARYHANLHAWRTDGWVYDDGAIWFPQGGPLGTRLARKPAAWKYRHWGQGTGDDKELWRQVRAKACYCHFYGAGLVDHFLLTGSRDSLEAARDLAEQKDSEFRKHRQFTPGESTISDTRGFGRGFYVITHLLEALPGDEFLESLAVLARDVLWQAPDLDERGFAPCHIGTGFGGFDPKKHIPAEMAAAMQQAGITMDERGWLTDPSGKTWPVICLGGTWQHAYVQAAADRYARIRDDEDMADFSYGFGRFAAEFLLSEECRQTHYYTFMDVPYKGKPWDPWKYEKEHTTTTDGEGCVHSGYYTRFFPDAIVMAYSLSGDKALLERAREFWHYGSKRRYRTKGLAAGRDEVYVFANHRPPKDDSVLSTCRMFRAWARPRRDAEPPEPVRDLEVSRSGDGRVGVTFTVPRDRGGGTLAGYQVKCAVLPIVSYEEYDHGRDDGLKRSFWRATNLDGEPLPGAPGTREKFTVRGVPEAGRLYFVVVTRDESGNRSALSNGAVLAR